MNALKTFLIFNFYFDCYSRILNVSEELYSNQITTLDENVFQGLTALTHKITSLDENVFKGLTALSDFFNYLLVRQLFKSFKFPEGVCVQTEINQVRNMTVFVHSFLMRFVI